jgi:hypothetical protein
MSQHVELERAETLEELIAARAYERWLRRGRPSGDGAEDWFAARAEIEAEQTRKGHDLQVAIFDE